MALLTNCTRYAAGEHLGVDSEGAEYCTLVVKATYRWRGDGAVELAGEMQPVLFEDVLAGAPGLSGPLLESDLVPAKPRVDVILAGKVALPVAVRQVKIVLQVGARIRKAALVFGDRRWTAGLVRVLKLSEPALFREMPFEWERVFGGTDPEDPNHTERRNPAGRGMRRKFEKQVGRPAPNFEDPARPIHAWDDRRRPVGFGPVGRHWEPRVRSAGTYDQQWLEERFPLPPADFNPRYFNCAPEDQQLADYRPGEEVRLTYMTVAGHERFRLPELEVPVTFYERGGGRKTAAVRPDTITIEPAERRFTLTGRATHRCLPSLAALQGAVVGSPARGLERAVATGKAYWVPRSSSGGRA